MIVYSDHSTPRVFVGTWYGVGSKDEPAGRTGFAHLFEHLMFQGTANRDGEFITAMTSIGATGVNGTTSNDRTNYYQVVPTASLDAALWLESDRMGYLLGGITQAVLDEQREVVRNEKRQREASPGSEIFEKSLQAFYPPGHPYRHTTIGSDEDIGSATMADVRGWFREKYGPNNAVLVLAGDIDVETAKTKVRAYFDRIPAGRQYDRQEQWMPVFSGVKEQVVFSNVPLRSYVRMWPLPNNDHDDTVLMSIVAQTLARGPGTPLYERLVEQEQLAFDVSSGTMVGEVNSTFSIQAAVRPGASVDRIEQIIDEELEAYFAEGPEEEQLARNTTSRQAAFIRALESLEGMGSLFAENRLFHGNAGRVFEEAKMQDAATPEQLARIAQRWLVDSYLVLHVLPANQTSTFPPQSSDLPFPTLEFAADEIDFPDVTEAVLDNGLRIVVAKQDRLPLMDVALHVNAGSLKDTIYGTNVSSTAMQLLLAGTQDDDLGQLKNRLDEMAVLTNVTSGRDHSQVAWNSLSTHADDAMALMSEVIRMPAFPARELQKITDQVDSRYSSYEQDPTQSASGLFNRAIWGEQHILGDVATAEEARSVTVEHLKVFHAAEFGPNNATLFVVSDLEPAEVIEMARRHFGDWEQADPADEVVPGEAQADAGRVILVDNPGAAQSVIVAGHLVSGFDPDTVAIKNLTNAIISGNFSSRLNMNLREDKGWSYGITGSIGQPRRGQGVMAISGSVQTDKTAASLAEIRNELSRFVTDMPATQAELERERIASLMGHASSYTTTGDFLNEMMAANAYGTPYDRAETSLARVKAVDLASVQAAAKTHFRPEDLTWVVVGDLARIRQSIMELDLGEVEQWDVYGEPVSH